MSVDVSNNVPSGALCEWPSLSPDGRFVLFASTAAYLVTNALAGNYHLYMRDLQANATTLVDVDTNGIGAALNLATAPQMTPDGRFVVFECPDADLVANDRNQDYDVFVRDLAPGATDLVSARKATLPSVTPNGPSLPGACSLSSDGRYVAFASEANNLVSGDNNGFRDIFVCDLLLGTNILASVAADGAGADNLSTEPAISGDGRYVAFSSSADNLVANDTNNARDVVVRDLQAGANILVSVNSSGASGNGASSSPAISSNGRYVLFRSLATDLASGSFSSGYDNLFVRDLQAGTNYALTHTPASSTYTPVGVMTSDGRFVAFCGSLSGSSPLVYVWDTQAALLVYTNTLSGVSNLAVSADGNRIAYVTNNTLGALDRVAKSSWTIGTLASTAHRGPRFTGDGRWLVYVAAASSTNQVYLYDLLYRTNFLVSHAYNSAGGAYGASDWPEISSDGRFVAYRSAASNIVTGDTNGVPDIFLYDRLTNLTTCLSVNRFGTGAGDSRSLAPAFSGDGQTLVFQSWASDLVAQDFNQSSDLFAYGLDLSGAAPQFSAAIVSGAGPGQGPG